MMLVERYLIDLMSPGVHMTSTGVVFLLMLTTHVTTELDPQPQG